MPVLILMACAILYCVVVVIRDKTREIARLESAGCKDKVDYVKTLTMTSVFCHAEEEQVIVCIGVGKEQLAKSVIVILCNTDCEEFERVSYSLTDAEGGQALAALQRMSGVTSVLDRADPETLQWRDVVVGTEVPKVKGIRVDALRVREPLPRGHLRLIVGIGNHEESSKSSRILGSSLRRIECKFEMSE